MGSYPAVSLAEAGRARDAARLQKHEGKNPIQVRKVEKLKASNPGASTFRDVALEWHGKQSSQWSAGSSLQVSAAAHLGDVLLMSYEQSIVVGVVYLIGGPAH